MKKLAAVLLTGVLALGSAMTSFAAIDLGSVGGLLQEVLSEDTQLTEAVGEAAAVAGQVAGQAAAELADLESIAWEVEVEDGVSYFDLEYTQGDLEYEFRMGVSDRDLKGKSRKLTDAAREGLAKQEGAAFIGEDAAREAALEHAGLTAADVTFKEVGMDIDNDIQVYKVEFVSSAQDEYEYKIDPVEGRLIAEEIEYH